MKTFWLGLLFLCISPAAQAQLFDIAYMHVIFEPNSDKDGQTFTLEEDGVILQTTGYSPRSVKLEEDVTIGTFGSGYDLKAGSILFGRYDSSVWTYCGFFKMNSESTAAGVIALGVLTAGTTLLLEPFTDRGDIMCAYDSDNDGKFDSGWGSSDQVKKTDSLLIYSLREKKLSQEVAYTQFDPATGMRMPFEVKCKKVSKRPRILFTLQMAGTVAGRKMVDIPVPGDDPVEVEIAGVKLKLKSYDSANKTITYEVEEGFKSRYERVRAIQFRTYGY